MSESSKRVIRLDQLDPELSKAIMKAGGKNLYYCFQCGTCASSCPIVEYDDSYTPRLIVRSAVLGVKQVLKDEKIWLCADCNSCAERCPRGISPTNVIRILRRMAAKQGNLHEFYRTQAAAIVKDGRIWSDEEFVNEIREDMGLPNISLSNIAEVSAMLEDTKVKELLVPRNKKGELKK